jgi:hypothetical protein
MIAFLYMLSERIKYPQIIILWMIGNGDEFTIGHMLQFGCEMSSKRAQVLGVWSPVGGTILGDSGNFRR